MDGDDPISCQKHSLKLSKGLLKNITWYHAYKCWNAVLNSTHRLDSLQSSNSATISTFHSDNELNNLHHGSLSLSSSVFSFQKQTLVFMVIKLIWKEVRTVESTEVKSLRGVALYYYSWAFIAVERKEQETESTKREATWRDIYNILNKSRNPLPQSYTQCESFPAESPSFEISLLAFTSETENSLGVLTVT